MLQETSVTSTKNKELYNKLLAEKENGKVFSKVDLTKDILLELSINEGIIDSLIANLFNITKNQLRYLRKKYGIQNIFLVKSLKEEQKNMAYNKIKELYPDETLENFDEMYYESLYYYGKLSGWSKEFMSQNIPNYHKYASKSNNLKSEIVKNSILNKKDIKMIFNCSILDLSILDYIEKDIKKFKIDDYYENDYNLIINFNSQDLSNGCLNEFKFSCWRPWHTAYDFLEKLELALRIIASEIKKIIEYSNFHIKQIIILSEYNLKNTEIKMVKVGVHDYNNKRKDSVKIQFNTHLLDNRSIFKISDTIEHNEEKFYIDERNNNKKLYNSLLLKKDIGERLEIKELSEQDWKQLLLKEKNTTKDIADLYDLSERDVTKARKSIIPNIKQYDDEYLFYFIMLNNMTINDFYSNFCIPILEEMKLKNIKTIYEYLNPSYHEIFNVEEELKRQKEIEKSNLEGQKYEMPLSGVLLKKLYWAVKNNQLDRKILKNNWFNTYYGPMFLKNFLQQIEESHILDLYDSGKIYKHDSFETYQKLYQKFNLNESEEDTNQQLTLVNTSASKAYLKEKGLRKIVPRDYVELTRVKSEVGRVGEELVYKYELENLKDYPKFQKKIKKTYLIDDGAGYDIESYDYNGNKIFIEVKTSKLNHANRIKFFVSENEDAFISSHENAYIYYIYDLKNPKLRVIDQKTYLSYYKKAIKYEIDQEII